MTASHVSSVALSLVVSGVLSACSFEASAIVPGDGGAMDAASDAPQLDSGARDGAADTRRDVDVADSESPDADAGSPDTGITDYYDVDWGEPVALTATADPTFCETDASVTGDGRWLMFTRSTDPAGCYLFRRYHVMAWNDGSPGGPVTLIPTFDAAAFPETNAHPVDGAALGRPGLVLFYHAAQPSAGPRDVRAQWLSADGSGAPVVPSGAVIDVSTVNTPDAESDPTLNGDGSELFFTRFGDIYSTRGSAPNSYADPVRVGELSTGRDELDPALSPDGRVLVLARRTGVGDLDLYVARRRDPAGAFEAPVRLSRGASSINTTAEELDGFVTPSGDLLFTSDRDGVTRLFRAPLAP